MSAISQQSSGYTAVNLKATGDAVAGRIVGFEDYQVKVFGTNDLKFFPSGDPVMGVRIHLETNPGDESSRVTLWAEKANMLKAIAKGVREAGASDIEIGGDLAVTRTGMDGRAITYSSAYSNDEGE